MYCVFNDKNYEFGKASFYLADKSCSLHRTEEIFLKFGYIR